MDYLAIFLALTPVILLIILLGFLKVPGDKSAFYTLIVTIFLAALGFSLVMNSLSLTTSFTALSNQTNFHIQAYRFHPLFPKYPTI